MNFLYNFFKYKEQVIDITRKDKSNLTSSFKLLIENLWPNNNIKSSKNYYAPEEFKNKITTMNLLFKGIEENNENDFANFINFIIMTLHKELNKVKNNNSNNNNIILDQTNQKLMFNYFIESFIANNQSIISDLFYGVNCNIIKCYGCGAKTFNYQAYFIIEFPLEEVYKSKFNSFNNLNSNLNNLNNYNIFNNFNSNDVSIFDCFEYDRKINFMSGNNAIKCNFCNGIYNSSFCSILATVPRILILLLNRGENIEFNVKFIFTEFLNLTNYVQFNIGAQYKLIGVTSYIGKSGVDGHFIAYCRDPLSNIWYKYNDDIVIDVTDFQNEVINFGMACLLFYQKIG